jgi:hypothetical protein
VIKRILTAVVALCWAVIGGPASAAPVSWTFDMPAFDGGTNAGITSVLEITADNGGSSISGQSFLNTQITAMNVLINGSGESLSLIKDSYSVIQGSTTYITTDAAGRATLDLTASFDTSVRFKYNYSIYRNAIQLGTRDDAGGPTRYSVQIRNVGYTRAFSDIVVVSRAVAPVPEVSATGSLAAIASLLALMAFLWERRRVSA